MKEKLLKLCENKEFAEKLNSLKTEEEVIEFLKNSGVEVNSVEELKTLMQPESKELDADELNQAAGGFGFICFGVGLGDGLQCCWSDGSGDAAPSGPGVAMCCLVGFGLGAGANRA